jgi:hypothetical protein
MTEDELQAIEARAEAATAKAFNRASAWEVVVTVGVSQQDVPALVAEVRRLRRFVKGALIALPSPVGKALLDDCEIEYAENTTPMT